MRNLPDPPIYVLTATGAYGRDATLNDWNNGRDFEVFKTGPYFSIRDCAQLKGDGYTTIEFWTNRGIAFIVDL